MLIGNKVMVTEKKDKNKFKYDGKSRPSDDTYRKNYNDIFNKIQQEQRDLDESYRQSLKNKKERMTKEIPIGDFFKSCLSPEEREKMIKKENEEYLKEIEKKL